MFVCWVCIYVSGFLCTHERVFIFWHLHKCAWVVCMCDVCLCLYVHLCLSFLLLPPLSSSSLHPSWSASTSTLLICDLDQGQSTELPRPSQGWVDLSPWYHILCGFSPWTQPGSSASEGLILSCEDRILALINRAALGSRWESERCSTHLRQVNLPNHTSTPRNTYFMDIRTKILWDVGWEEH